MHELRQISLSQGMCRSYSFLFSFFYFYFGVRDTSIVSNSSIVTSVTLPTELRGRTEKIGDDKGGESRRRESKATYECCATKNCEHK